MKTIKDLLISVNELDRLYLGHAPVHLWRATKIGENAPGGLLHPEFTERQIGRARVRAPDIETYEKRAETWVRAALGRGVSLFDRPHVFPGRDWRYFLLPEGTEIPAGLAMTRDNYSDRFKATHYSLLPNHDMPAKTYLKLLDQLAANALRRREEASDG